MWRVPLLRCCSRQPADSLCLWIMPPAMEPPRPAVITAASGSLTFDPGTTSGTISVPINGDFTPEPDQTFVVALSHAVNATIQRAQAVGTIVDNDARTQSFTASSIVVSGFGPASSYPSTVNVFGFPGTIIGLSVRLNNVSHSFPADLDVLLVGPTGEKVVVMSDAGGGGDTPLNDVTMTFSDQASLSLPQDQITSGIYLPTDHFPPDTFPSPAPGGPYGSRFSAFNGAQPERLLVSLRQ